MLSALAEDNLSSLLISLLTPLPSFTFLCSYSVHIREGYRLEPYVSFTTTFLLYFPPISKYYEYKVCILM